MLLPSLLLTLVAQVCGVDAGCVCACARPDSGVHLDAAPAPDAAPDSGVFADAAVPVDSGVFPDAAPADTGVAPDAGFAVGSLAGVNRQATRTSPAPLGAGQCAGGGVATPGLVALTVTVQGVARSALVSVPPRALLGGPLPVVIGYHGHSWQGAAFRGTTNAQGTFVWTDPQLERTLQLTAPDDTDGAIMVFPNGLASGPCGSSFGWDLGNAGATRDVEFTDAILSWLSARYCIDIRRLYLYGRSCGGGMVYEVMARRPTTFAAGFVVNGYRNFGLYVTEPAFPPTNLLVIHGGADPTVPLSVAAVYGRELPLRNANPGETCSVSTVTAGLANQATCTLTVCARGDTRYCVAPTAGHFPPVPLSTNESVPWFESHARQ